MKIKRLILLLSVGLILFGPAEQARAVDEMPFYDPSATSGCETPGGSLGGNVDTSQMPETIPEPHKTLFAQAAAAYDVSPQFLAALFLSEHANQWSPFDSQWASSPVGASGPFQFMPGTWDASKVDGNGDGVMDVQNIYDAAFSAANLVGKGTTASTPLGDVNKPFARQDTLIYMAGAYNWGGGNMNRVRKRTPDAGPSVMPAETQAYIRNIHALITSRFTTGAGAPRYPNPVATAGGTAAPAPVTGVGCSGSVIAGNIVQTALNFAWDTPGHGRDRDDARPTFQDAMPKYNGSVGDFPYSDCGVFVATVMIASGVDPDYPRRGTAIQIAYLRRSTDKYEVFENITDTGDLRPGDILIFSARPYGHTYIYTGPQSGTDYTAVGASLRSHVPQVAPTVLNSRGNHFTVARLRQ